MINNSNCWLLIILLFLANSSAAIQPVIDDEGNTIILQAPAQRIISLSPGITELLFAAGGKTKIKGVVSFSNYPQEARQLPVIGSFNALDMEKIISLKPDLVIAWKTGNPLYQLKTLQKTGITLYFSEPEKISDIPATIKRFGLMMGTEKIANAAAATFKQRLLEIKQRYPDKSNKKRVFIQIWDKPLMSITAKHLISKIVSLCGGNNIFADDIHVNQDGLTLRPDLETVLQRDPEIIIATGDKETSQHWLEQWQQWDFIAAVKNQQHFTVNPDVIVRHTPRLLDGIEQVCRLIYPD